MRDFNTYLYLTTSLKGGGGKSAFANILVDALRSTDTSIAAYDADGAIGSLSDMHAQRDPSGQMIEPQCPLKGVCEYNIRDESRDMLLNSLQAGHTHVLHDTAGGSLVDVQRLFADQDSLAKFFRSLQTLNACVVFFHLITPDVSTIESVALHLDLADDLGSSLSQHARHIAVLNRHGDRRDQDFPHWFGSVNAVGEEFGGKTRARLIKSGGAEMNLPGLRDRTMSLLKNLNVPYSQAIRDPRLLLMDQQRIQIFTEDFQKELTPQVRTLMGLSS